MSTEQQTEMDATDLHELNRDTCDRCLAGISAPHLYTEFVPET